MNWRPRFAGERYVARTHRLAREQADKVARVAARREALAQQQDTPTAADPDTIAATPTEPAVAARMDKSAVLAAIARGKARRAHRGDAAPDTTPTPDDASRDAP